MIPNNKGKKIILSLAGIFTSIMLILGISYAMFYYQSTDPSDNTLTTALADLTMSFTNQNNSINMSNAVPMSDADALSLTQPYTFTITNDSLTNAISYQVNLLEYGYEGDDSNTFPDKTLKVGIKKNSEEVKIHFLTSNYVIGESDLAIGATDTYSVWMWIDEVEGVKPEKDASNKVYRGYFNLSTFDYVTPNAPVLDTGMIPVKYDEALASWVKADSTNTDYDWYNYANKRWANVVLVSDASRATYLANETSIGTPINDDDILAFYVWIPRYKYELFNLSTSSTVAEQEIEILFEVGDATTGTGTLLDEYLTHPAFTFGDDELTGIWVGKFETTPGTTQNAGTTNPTVLPNTYSWTIQNISTQYMTALKFAGGTLANGVVNFSGSTTYGLTSSTDSHMMKNTEWGAVAYLTNSKYGRCTNNICEEVAINDSGYITGRSNGSMKIPTSSRGKYKYNDIKVYEEVSSVNGNISNVNLTINPNDWIYQNGYYKNPLLSTNETTTSMIVSFTLASEGVLSFDYGVSSRSHNNGIYYTINNGTTTTGSFVSTGLSGNYYGDSEANIIYNHKAIKLEAGSYTVTFSYYLLSSNLGLNLGFVKNISVQTGTVTTKRVLLDGVSGTNSSTTGNIYGIYDMSGGAYEYVMGVLGDNDDLSIANPRSGNTVTLNSGFSGMLTDGTPFAADPEVLFPNPKYYNLYGDTSTRILGDATRETAGWYGDYQTWGSARAPWFIRGGCCLNGTSTGAFSFYGGSAHANNNYSFRSVLANK